jgi:hypothetical protein
MSTFKLKPEKTRHITEINTLDEKHHKKMSDFKTRKKQLPGKKKRLDHLRHELEKYQLKDTSLYTTNDIRNKSRIKSEIDELVVEIYDIENNISELEYYSQINDLLMDYYDIVQQEDYLFYQQHPELSEAKTDIDKKDNAIDHLDYLNMLSRDKKKKPKKPTKRRKKRDVDTKTTNIMSFFGSIEQSDSETTVSASMTSVTSVTSAASAASDSIDTESIIETEKSPTQKNKLTNRAALFDEYMMLTDNEYLCEKRNRINPIKKCDRCGNEKVINPSEGSCVCLNCGDSETMILDSEKPNYKDSCAPEKPGYPYKRSNHLSEWLAQFQAKESTEIPDSVYEQIEAELKKERVVNYTELSLPYMKKILKKLNLTSYYEHRTHIISKLSCLPPPTISRDTEERIRLMFRQIQAPFEKHCPPDRLNFLSYSYVLHKFFELLELDELVDYFPLLKSRDKLRQQDKIWEKICEELKWQFIPSV